MDSISVSYFLGLFPEFVHVLKSTLPSFAAFKSLILGKSLHCYWVKLTPHLLSFLRQSNGGGGEDESEGQWKLPYSHRREEAGELPSASRNPLKHRCLHPSVVDLSFVSFLCHQTFPRESIFRSPWGYEPSYWCQRPTINCNYISRFLLESQVCFMPCFHMCICCASCGAPSLCTEYEVLVLGCCWDSRCHVANSNVWRGSSLNT